MKLVKNKRTKPSNQNAKLNDEIKALKAKIKSLSVKNQTPFAEAGGHLGSMLGYKDLGRNVGGFIGRILGRGDYTTNFADVKSNQLLSAPVPAFGNQGGTVITHREFIADVIGKQSFTSTAYPINPGMQNTFPWLAAMGENYEEYEILGLIFEFKSMSGDSVGSTTTNLGTVIMATQYNADDPSFVSKQQMENYEFAVSGKPSESFMHALECKPHSTALSNLYIRTGSLPAGQDYRFSDFGNFTLAVVGQQVDGSNLGELWVSYKIALKKPKLTNNVYAGVQSWRYRADTPTIGNPFGGSNQTSQGSLSMNYNTSGFSFNQGVVGVSYLVTIMYAGLTQTACAMPGLAFTNCTQVSILQDDTQSSLTGGYGYSTGVRNYTYTFVLKQTALSASVVMNTSNGVLPLGSPTIDVFVVALDASIVP